MIRAYPQSALLNPSLLRPPFPSPSYVSPPTSRRRIPENIPCLHSSLFAAANGYNYCDIREEFQPVHSEAGENVGPSGDASLAQPLNLQASIAVQARDSQMLGAPTQAESDFAGDLNFAAAANSESDPNNAGDVSDHDAGWQEDVAELNRLLDNYPGTSPLPRDFPSLLAHHGRLFVFGGRYDPQIRHDNLYDSALWELVPIVAAPDPRSIPTKVLPQMVADIASAPARHEFASSPNGDAKGNSNSSVKPG
ncbi:unnamed protein product [Protopolystoma xenopodis]|uniref:Uncharacterized protein n=1 Tax=Protopolystoma xenopodis TaxID=117903 RepID=A0A448WXD4_9PLAT|nr:unnamed protein product [Protopolystoma xenopodis]